MASQRGLLGSLFDRATSRYLLGLSPETCSYKTTSVRIPILDNDRSDQNIDLAADLYQPVLPDGHNPAGTILVRCPYGRGILYSFTIRPYAARGYNVLLVSTRGTFGSSGNFVPFVHEEKDGHAVVAWMRKQDWYTGSFATIGMSYLGFTQWALLNDPPHDMVAAVISVGPHDFAQQGWGTGAFALDNAVWAELTAHQEDSGLSAMVGKATLMGRMKKLFNNVPLEPALKEHFEGKADWLVGLLEHSDLDDPRYDSWRFPEALEKANIPILLISGWYDLFLRQSMHQYTRLQERKTNIALTVGPWRHLNIGMDGKSAPQTLDWLDEHLAKRRVGVRTSPVEYYMTGANEWRKVPRWPPATTPTVLYFGPDNTLLGDGPTKVDSPWSFTVDPKNPTPAIGGNVLLGGGSVNDSALASRADVLIFTTKPLERDLEIAGKVMVDLNHSSENPSSDLFVRLSEVGAKGTSRNITETYKRLSSDGTVNGISITMDDCAHRVFSGSRIRLLIAGASHPHYALSTVIGTDGKPQTVEHKIHPIGDVVTRITIPVVS
ncbi:CocE/NonD hydrolase [Aaosphaeria arxii CBS 175.79]|uniref:CocE/NonD hydrolase n=1 Tax=Aaosphaeria arxii CBS 175.79 TaxID=1450172 RepID=A0A6A5X7N5_9PLEO|nr:CocE/NonD hydrolase [Aaosphaeria arxii CBS 175.79]KAF2008942.1 CocE/NonD hydrolase [Aaosphaeria arxii CBS 175.79]